jgi:hypothetical protein
MLGLNMPAGEHFFHSRRMPFVEARRSSGSARHFKPHLHRRLSIGAIDRGDVIYEVNGQKARFGPGALALINPDTLHACNPVGSQARSYCVLYFDIAWCAQVQKACFFTGQKIHSAILTNEMTLKQFTTG